MYHFNLCALKTDHSKFIICLSVEIHIETYILVFFKLENLKSLHNFDIIC